MAAKLASSKLASLLQDPRIWRGDSLAVGGGRVESSGYPALDVVLPGGGWPGGAVSEVVPSTSGRLPDHANGGELSLLLPLLARLTRAGRRVVLIAPPLIPYAPAWQQAGIVLDRLLWLTPASEADQLWATEQVLRENCCAGVVSWCGPRLDDRACRRLQMAAETGGGCGFVVRRGAPDTLSSPLALRLGVTPAPSSLQVRVLKRRGAPLLHPLTLTPPHLHVVAGLGLPAPAARRVAAALAV